MPNRHTILLATGLGALSLLTAACQDTSDPDTTPMVQPGESTVAIEGITYDMSSAGDGGSPPNICSYTRPGNTVAIVEGIQKGRILSKDTALCDGKYFGEGNRGPINVLAVAAGQELPATIDDAVAIGDFNDWRWPEAGETFLVSLRYARGEWFMFSNMRVELTTNTFEITEQDVESNGVGFPNNFEDLASLASDQLSDYDRHCPAQANWSQEEWEQLIFEPDPSECRQDDEPVDRNNDVDLDNDGDGHTNGSNGGQ